MINTETHHENLLTRTTQNFAARRHLDAVLDKEGDLEIYEVNGSAADYSEPCCVYRQHQGQPGFFWGGNIYLPPVIKDELPVWIKNEKHLRQVLNYLAGALCLLQRYGLSPSGQINHPNRLRCPLEKKY